MQINTKSLTGLRCVAAWLVFFHHYPIMNINAICKELHIGVSVFYVLSGFLIGFNYLEKMRIDIKTICSFYYNRIIRIYPVYFLILIILFVYTREIDLRNIFNQITLLKGLSDSLKFTGVAQAWSLTVEFTFYFFAPLIMIAIKKFKTKGLVGVTFIALVLGLATSYVCNMISISYFENVRFVLIYTFFGRVFEFAIGIYLAMVVLNKNNIIFCITQKTHIGIIVQVVGVALLILNQSEQYVYGVFSPWGIIANNYLFPIGTTILIAGLVTEDTVIAKMLEMDIFQLLGKASYSFYIIHIGVIAAILSNLGFGLTNAGVFILMNIVAIVIYKFYEEPARKILKFKKKEVVLVGPEIDS